jgi:monoterpene epsilon-lactone hydrolase
MTTLMRVTDRAIRLRSRRSASTTVESLLGRDYPEPPPVPLPLRRDHLLSWSTVSGRPVLRLVPRSGASGEHLVYTHGGGYVHGLDQPHWWILRGATRGTGVTVTVPFYRLAPEGDAAQAYPFLEEVYAELVAEAGAEHVTLAGDSAGGGLALGQAMAYRDTGVPLPRQVVLLAPWLDVTLSHPQVPELAPLDSMLHVDRLRASGRLWSGDLHPTDPRVSPGYGSVAGLPPVHVLQGGRDLLAADARDLATRLAEAGNGGRAHFEDDGFHVYPAAFWTREGRRALATFRSLLRPPCRPGG